MRKFAVGGATLVVLSMLFVLLHGGVSAIGTGGDGHYAFLQMDPKYGGPVTYSSCRSIPVGVNLHGVDDQAATRRGLLGGLGAAPAARHPQLVFSGGSPPRPPAHWATVFGHPALVALAHAP